MAILSESASRSPAGTATRSDIIKAALFRLRAVAFGQPIPPEDLSAARYELNLILAELQNEGLHLWKQITATLFTTKGQSTYFLGGTSPNHWAESVIQDALTSSMVVTDTTIPVSDTSQMQANGFIGVVLDDATLDWHEITAVPTSTTVTIAASGIASAATSGNKVYYYAEKADRPLRIYLAERRDELNTDIPILVYSREEYQTLPNKTVTGEANLVYYNPLLGSGELQVWNPPVNDKGRIHLTVLMPIVAFRTDDEQVDFPQEWYMAVVDYLVARMCPYYGRLEELGAFEAIKEKSLDRAVSFGNASESRFFQPDNTRGR